MTITITSTDLFIRIFCGVCLILAVILWSKEIEK